MTTGNCPENNPCKDRTKQRVSLYLGEGTRNTVFDNAQRAQISEALKELLEYSNAQVENAIKFTEMRGSCLIHAGPFDEIVITAQELARRNIPCNVHNLK